MPSKIIWFSHIVSLLHARTNTMLIGLSILSILCETMLHRLDSCRRRENLNFGARTQLLHDCIGQALVIHCIIRNIFHFNFNIHRHEFPIHFHGARDCDFVNKCVLQILLDFRCWQYFIRVKMHSILLIAKQWRKMRGCSTYDMKLGTKESNRFSHWKFNLFRCDKLFVISLKNLRFSWNANVWF